MERAPKSLRLHIGIFGRTNVGKSSFLNFVAGQDVAITSPVPGTTTDVVEKTMELLPLGPVVFLDTAGLDDVSVLAGERIKKTRRVFDRSDVIVLVTEPGGWGTYEDGIVAEAAKRHTPFIVVINKIDREAPGEAFLATVRAKTSRVLPVSSVDLESRDATVDAFKKHLIEIAPNKILHTPHLVGDLLPEKGLAVFIVPIDLEAPKGRIILPQVQAIRDALDNNEAALVVKESEYKSVLTRLAAPPDLVVCDSQVVDKMVADTPPGVKCTTFSILFTRFRGDIVEASRGVRAIGSLKPGDRILVAEACSHHAIEDDIGRVKMPRWLKEYVGGKLSIDTCAGKDYPDDLAKYKLIIHCGGCMINVPEMLSRIEKARRAGVPITNYGLAISFVRGVIERVLEPFPEALAAYRSARV